MRLVHSRWAAAVGFSCDAANAWFGVGRIHYPMGIAEY